MNSNELHYLPDSHQKLIEVIATLPEFPILLLWRPEQTEYLKSLKCRWKWIGARIDYLQRQQSGFIDPDPADKLSDPRLRKYLIIYSDYLFQMLQVVIAGFKALQPACEKRNIDFDFINPRELFAAMCQELSEVEVARATSREVDVGSTITELRQGQSLVGKFYRGSLSKHETEAFCQEMENKGGLSGLVITSIYQHFRAYLHKPSTSIGFAWKNFGNSQKEVSRYLRSGEAATIRWNCGYPVWSDGGRPVRFSDP
jgi:hypothetical protein